MLPTYSQAAGRYEGDTYTRRFVCLLLGDKHFYLRVVGRYKYKLSKTSVLSRKNEPFMFPFFCSDAAAAVVGEFRIFIYVRKRRTKDI